MLHCEFCQRECKSNKSYIAHRVFCSNNPERKVRRPSSTTKGRPAWNKGLVGDPRCSQVGKIGKPHTEETKKKIANSTKGKIGGYREGSGRSKKFYVDDSYGKEVCLQSSYELKCSEILNELSIKWTRPSPLRYDDRLYYPDFYLTDLNIYLDPKNDYLIKLDEDKINKVIEQNNVKVIVIPNADLNIASLSKHFIPE